MLILTATPQQPDYIALGMVLCLAIVVIVLAVRKHQANKRTATQTPAPLCDTPAAAAADAPVAPGSAGSIKLHDVEPKTAAMLMAIVADKLGKPLNELRFISIKEVQ